jgi:topoisomerase-4 subunit A
MIGLDGKPQLKNLKMILAEWLVFRQQTVQRRLQYRLDKVTQRVHILEGLLIAFLNLDEIIKIIRIKDKPRPLLKARFQLTDIQVDAVLDLKLRQLAGLEENKIKAEQSALSQEQDNLEDILTSDKALKALMRKELLKDTKEYGNPRRSPLVERAQAQALEQTDLTPASPISVILSQKGWVRAGKGHELEAENLNYRAGDGFLSVVRGMSNQSVVFLDDHGRSYSLPADSFPSARSQGEALAGRISPPDGAQITIVLMDQPDSLWLLASNTGYGFICRLDDLYSKNKAGKRILNLSKDAKLMPPVRIQNVTTDHVALSNSSGHLLVIPLAEIPQMTKGKGVKLLTVHSAKQEALVALSALEPNTILKVISGKRHVTIQPKDIEEYQGGRAQRGRKLPKGFQRVDALDVIL